MRSSKAWLAGRKFVLRVLVLAVLSYAWAGSPSAHEGGPAEAAPVQVRAPRTEARLGTMELVAIYNRETLALFVSRFADGTPVSGAQVQASNDLEDVTLRETDPGIYMSRELAISPGRNDIRFTIAAAGQPEQSQSMALVVPGGTLLSAKTTSSVVAGRHSVVVLGAAAVAIYAVMMAVFALSGRRTPGLTTMRSRSARYWPGWFRLDRAVMKLTSTHAAAAKQNL